MSRDGYADNVVDWTVLKTIQEANAASMGAMEQYLLVATRPEVVDTPEQIQAFLERSIDHHERAIEHLEMAATELDASSEAR